MASNVRRPSKHISAKQLPEIWARIKNGEFLNRIAAHFDVNPGRIAEIKKGKLLRTESQQLGFLPKDDSDPQLGLF